MTSAVHALYAAAHGGVRPDGSSVCAVCGGPSGDHYESRAIMADTFTRYDVFRRPGAAFVCAACAWYLDGSGKHTGEPHVPFQKMSYVVAGWRWHSIEREQVRSLLRSWKPGPPAPVWLVLSRVKKKHLALLAQAWMPGSTVTVQFEEDTIRIGRADLDAMRRTIRRLLDRGIGKTVIESGRPPALALHGRDIAILLDLLSSLDPWRPSAALRFALWIAHTPDRKDAHGPTSARI